MKLPHPSDEGQVHVAKGGGRLIGRRSDLIHGHFVSHALGGIPNEAVVPAWANGGKVSVPPFFCEGLKDEGPVGSNGWVVAAAKKNFLAIVRLFPVEIERTADSPW